MLRSRAHLLRQQHVCHLALIVSSAALDFENDVLPHWWGVLLQLWVWNLKPAIIQLRRIYHPLLVLLAKGTAADLTDWNITHLSC